MIQYIVQIKELEQVIAQLAHKKKYYGIIVSLPTVFVRLFNVTSILKRSGNPGRDNLNTFAEVDIVSAFVVEVSKKMLDISVIKISDMLCKCIQVFCKNSSHDYVVQPNNFEHH